MIFEQEYPDDEVAYLILQPQIEQTYACGHFVAIHHGRIAADAASAEKLESALSGIGLTSKDVLVIRVGMPRPDITWIL